MAHTLTSYEQQAIDFLSATNTSILFTFDGFNKYFDDDKQKRNVFTWTLTRGSVSISGKFGDSVRNSCKETPILQSNEPVEIYAGIRTTDPNMPLYTNPKRYIYLSCTVKTNCSELYKIKKGKKEAESILPLTEIEISYTTYIDKYKKVRRTPTGIASSIDSFKNYVIRRIHEKINELENKTVLLDQSDTIVQPSAYDLLSCLTKYDPGTFENFCADFGYDSDSRKAEKIHDNVVKEWEQVKSIFTEYEIERLQEIQ